MKRSAKRELSNDGKNTSLGGSRLKRTIKALVAICLLGVALATLNVFTSRHDLAMATGPESSAQHDWFVDAAERPDIAAFFKALPHAKRVTMAMAIGRYDDAPLAKLIGKLLADFDADARAALTVSLQRVAAAHPEAVASQFTQKGSFQTLGISEALKTQGPKVLPAVADMLANADARPAAVAYLVRAGDPAIPVLIPKLDDKAADVPLAAADALGQMRAKAAVVPLFLKLKNATPADRPGFLAAIAAIGDPSTEQLMAETLQDPNLPLSERTPAALGLGRIGGERAARLLWNYATSDEPNLASASLAALSVIGGPALAIPGTPPALRIQVAAAVPGPEGDAAIRAALQEPATRLAAIQAADGRDSLTADLATLIPANKTDGDLASALVDVLSATPAGRNHLLAYRDDPYLSGFIKRVRNEAPLLLPPRVKQVQKP